MGLLGVVAALAMRKTEGIVFLILHQHFVAKNYGRMPQVTTSCLQNNDVTYNFCRPLKSEIPNTWTVA